MDVDPKTLKSSKVHACPACGHNSNGKGPIANDKMKGDNGPSHATNEEKTQAPLTSSKAGQDLKQVSMLVMTTA